MNLTEAVRQAAREVLEKDQAEIVLGYTKGSYPWRNRVIYISRPEEVERLVWPSFGVLSLANYLHKLKGKKVALLANGCTARAVNVLLQEDQLKREDLFIVGVPCPGMLDPSKVRSLAPQLVEDNFKDEVLIITSDNKVKIRRDELLRTNCLECRHPTPPLYDVLIEAEPKNISKDPYQLVSEIEEKDVPSRWEWFTKEILSRCLRCYACRQACPLCYCPTCFVDDSRPQWVGKTRDLIDTALYHLVRAYHLAGRCVDCGSCEAACPMDIPLRLLTKKLEKEAFTVFSYEAGLDSDKPLLLQDFAPDDPEDFMITHILRQEGKI